MSPWVIIGWPCVAVGVVLVCAALLYFVSAAMLAATGTAHQDFSTWLFLKGIILGSAYVALGAWVSAQ